MALIRMSDVVVGLWDDNLCATFWGKVLKKVLRKIKEVR